MIERRPEGGLPYRITIDAAATAQRPSRLVIWLHPTGGYYNEAAETLLPALLGQGFALMVMTDKDTRGWTYEHAKMLLGATLPDAGTIPGVDLRRPLLLGFSAGGQVALRLWSTKPELYGGVVIDAAYPADTVNGKDVLYSPPNDPAIRDVPMLVFVGTEDKLLWVWRSAEKPWKEMGVPLELHAVPGRGHAWLFGKDQIAVLESWLARLPELPPAGDTAAAPLRVPDQAAKP